MSMCKSWRSAPSHLPLFPNQARLPTLEFAHLHTSRDFVRRRRRQHTSLSTHDGTKRQQEGYDSFLTPHRHIATVLLGSRDALRNWGNLVRQSARQNVETTRTSDCDERLDCLLSIAFSPSHRTGFTSFSCKISANNVFLLQARRSPPPPRARLRPQPKRRSKA